MVKLKELMAPLYASMEYRPVRYTPIESWWLVDGKWVPVHPAIVGKDASVMTAADYEKLYPNLPALPAKAFTKGTAKNDEDDTWPGKSYG